MFRLRTIYSISLCLICKDILLLLLVVVVVVYRGYSIYFAEYGFHFIESSGKDVYIMSGEATNEIYFFHISRVK